MSLVAKVFWSIPRCLSARSRPIWKIYFFHWGSEGCTMVNFKVVRAITYPKLLRWPSYCAGIRVIHRQCLCNIYFGLVGGICWFVQLAAVQYDMLVPGSLQIELRVVWRPWPSTMLIIPIVVPHLSPLHCWNRDYWRVREFDRVFRCISVHVPGRCYSWRTWCSPLLLFRQSC